ncbi:MAG TPA: hypothetical protein V6C88_13160, partial [Chroococcidiopsis sp.]
MLKLGQTQWRSLSLLSLMLLAACSSTPSTGESPDAATKFNAAKGCMNVGVLLPESDSSARYEAYDRPLL